MKHRCNQILELGIPLGGLAKLFAQDWEGDVTVVMPATLAQVPAKDELLIKSTLFFKNAKPLLFFLFFLWMIISLIFLL